MADVRTENGLETRAKRIQPAIKRGGVHGIVGFATEVKIRDKQILDVFGCFNPAARPIIQRVRVFAGAGHQGFCIDQTTGICLGPFAAVALIQLKQLLGIQIGRVVIVHLCAVALLPVADHIGVQITRPTNPAFQEAELERRKPPRDAAHEHGFTQGLARGRKMSDVVIHIIRDGSPTAPAHGRRVKGRRDLQFHTTRPDRVVIIRAVQTERIQPKGVLGHLRGGPFDHRNGTLDMPGHHYGLEPEFAHHKLKLFNRLLRGVHGNGGRRGHPAGILAEILGMKGIERAAACPAYFGVFNMRELEAQRRIEHGKVQADSVHPFGQELGQHGGGAIQSILGRQRPPRRARRALVQPFFRRQRIPAEQAAPAPGVTLGRKKALDHGFTALALEIVKQAGFKFDHMAV